MYVNNAKLNRCKKLLDVPVKVDRNKEPPKCRLCQYYQPDFRYRRCLFSACPYGKDRNTAFRKKPLRNEKIIGKEVGGMDADDFIIGVIGSKADAEEIKRKVGEFLNKELNLILSDEKTKITHSAEKIRFLGYDISVSHSHDQRRDKNGHLKRSWYGAVKLYVPKEKWYSKLLEYDAMHIRKCKNGQEMWKPNYRGKCINMPDAQIVSKFNGEIRGIYNYYRLACNVSVLGNFYRIMRAILLSIAILKTSIL